MSKIHVLFLPSAEVVFSFFTVLAISDLLSLGFCISPLHHILNGATLHHSTAVWYSYFELLFVGVAMSTSVFIVVCITVYRFFSVCRPAEFKRLNTPRFAWGSMAAAFGTSVIAWLPMSFLREPRVAGECHTDSFTPQDNQTWWVACLIHDTSEKGYFIAYAWVRQTLVTFLPIVAVVTLNLLTLRGFLQHRKMRRRMLNQHISHQPSSVMKTREEKYLMGLLIAVMSSFVITIVPSGIANAINSSTKTSELEFVIFSAVANNLEILNHTLNFYLYILCSKQVRDILLQNYNKHRTKMTWKFEGFSFSREVRSETSDACEERQKRNSESPLSRLRTDTHKDEIYVISRTTLPSEIPPALCQGMDNNVRHEENGQNVVRQDRIFPHVMDITTTPAVPSGHDNPNFEYFL